MFFLLSKVIGLFINPLIWILILLFLSFLLKSKRNKRIFLITTIVVTCFFSNSFLLNKILLKWEPKPVAYSELKPSYDYAIVLSGMLWYDTETERVNFLQSSDRIWQAVKLYKEGRVKKILISGGAVGMFGNDAVESAILKDFLIKIGISETDIVAEDKSRSTRENALFTAELLKSMEYSNLLLVTSATHMRRSVKCFTKVGLTCDTYPVDYYSGESKLTLDFLLIPSIRTLLYWNAFIHELFGVVSYKMAGYI